MSTPSRSDIFFSCADKQYRSIENNVPSHALIHVYAGSLHVTDVQGTYILHAGDTALFYRNMLAKFVKIPSADGPFKSVAIGFSQSFLHKFYSDHHPEKTAQLKWQIHPIAGHPLLTSLFQSILPYDDLAEGALPPSLIEMKLQEAITILRVIDNTVDGLLANFAEPGKVDLVDFMQKHYSFNIPLRQFAQLTGRSLATFKRDFQKAFNTSPQKWLTERRLNQAKYLIQQKNQRPSEVYLDVGFENLSHFSRAFKQYFGYNPSRTGVSF